MTYSTERNIWIHLPGFCESYLLHRLGVLILNSGNVLIGQTSLLTLRQSPIINFPRECGGWCWDVHDVVRSTALVQTQTNFNFHRFELLILEEMSDHTIWAAVSELNTQAGKKCLGCRALENVLNLFSLQKVFLTLG